LQDKQAAVSPKELTGGIDQQIVERWAIEHGERFDAALCGEVPKNDLSLGV
jgi:hypothetical protein